MLALLAALLVWFVGPLLAVADYKFWESPTSRLLSISLMFLVWGLAMVFVSWRAEVRRKAVEDSDGGQERLRRDGLIEDEQKELRSRFKDALRTLKTSSLYRGRSERWRNELPWYLLIGPQGKRQDQPAGLFRTGVPDQPDRPQADPRYRRHALLRLVLRRPRRPDRHRRALPDPSRRRGRQGRLGDPARPVAQAPPRTAAERRDGVDSGGNVAQRRRDGAGYAGSPGARAPAGNPADPDLDLPVYLVLSKADQLLGFDEFFDQLSREESDQVLGTSFGKGAERHRCDGPASRRSRTFCDA